MQEKVGSHWDKISDKTITSGGIISIGGDYRINVTQVGGASYSTNTKIFLVQTDNAAKMQTFAFDMDEDIWQEDI